MEEQGKKANGTVDQMIEHMTADLQNSDGQYIQLGFTPPPTPSEPIWPEYAQGQLQNPFVQYGARSPELYVDQAGRYVGYNSYVQNQMFVEGYDKMDKYVVYQTPQYVMPNRDMSYYYPENREYALFASQEVLQPAMNREVYVPDMMQEKMANRHIIENLVGNWAPDNSGTYSPFGSPRPMFEKDEVPKSEFKPKPNVKKAKQIAEVKPMRPSYSDVLTKSAPQPPKIEKLDSTKLKNQVKKNKSDKFAKSTNFSRQTSSVENKENFSANDQKCVEKNRDAKPNLSRKWVSLDDVHDTETELFKDVESAKGKKKKAENPVKNEHKKKNLKDTNTSIGCHWTDNEEVVENTKTDEKIGKNPSKKVSGKDNRSAVRQSRVHERGAEKPPGGGKKSQRVRKRDDDTPFGVFSRTVRPYVSRWSRLVLCALLWLFNLVSDIFSMSMHLARDLGTVLWDSLITYAKSLVQNVAALLKRVKIFGKIGAYIDRTFGNCSWAFWNHDKNDKGSAKPEGKTWLDSGLEHNITMPLTGEEAMKRLLACKGKDPYSILGVRPDCTDDDIKRYYKRQAFLVHPDKNPQPGAEEAFKILVHAFDIIGEPERRQSYDRKVAESHQVEQAWSELNDLLSQLHQKMEYAANTIRCTNCTKRHRRLSVERPCYAARMCSQCKIHHSAKEGDIWAEARYLGFLWHYYACMDGAVYDITEWAGCQRKNLKHLRPNSHNVQYRIVLGKQGQAGGPGGTHRRSHKAAAATNSEREADIESFLNNLYNQPDMGSSGNTATHPDTNGRSDTTRSRKKNKRKK